MVATFAAQQQFAQRPVTHRDPRLALSNHSNTDAAHSQQQHEEDEEEHEQQHELHQSQSAWLDGSTIAGEGDGEDEQADSLLHDDGETDTTDEHDGTHEDEASAAYEESMLHDAGEPVQVAVRCRPLLASEQNYAASASAAIRSPVSGGAAGAHSRICVSVSDKQVLLGRTRAFEFDHAYGPESTQQEVYEGCAAGMVKAAFKGFACTIFAYGQTGSGQIS